MLIHNAAIVKQLTDYIDNACADLKTRLAFMSPTTPHEVQLTWSLRGQIQSLEQLKKKLLEQDDKE